MKKILIISPYFPPSNGADMQRIRMSLPYFEALGWKAEVVTVDSKYADIVKDDLLIESVPKDIKIHKVSAFSKKWTSKIGLGSLALRSIWFYKKYVDALLEKEHFDLVYFSTTQFPVLILGTHWKNKFNIPFVIDMQDPWHSTYYEDKSKSERPKKYWFSYRLNKYLEPIAMKKVDGLISVSAAYIETLKQRYPRINNIPCKVITFGAFERDFEIAKLNPNHTSSYQKEKDSINFVYVGRGGHDMKLALEILFKAFKKGLVEHKPLFEKVRFQFIGTSYAPNGEGIPTIAPIAEALNISKFINEQTDRISFYQGITTLQEADALLILGSNDEQYTASKIYPYILAKRPILSFFHPKSSAATIIKECNAGEVISLSISIDEGITNTYQFLLNLLQTPIEIPKTNWQKFNAYSAENMTKQQGELFNQILKNERI